MEAKVGLMWPQVKEGLQPSEATGSKSRFSPGVSRRKQLFEYPDVSPLRLILDSWSPEP